MNRRKILGGMIAAPFAGKKMAQSVVLTDAMTMTGAATLGRTASSLGGPACAPSPASGGIGFRAAVKAFGGIPDWIQDEWRDNARRYARTLDPDIASLRSTSLSHKMMVQRERYVDNAKRESFGDTFVEEAKKRWYQIAWGHNG